MTQWREATWEEERDELLRGADAGTLRRGFGRAADPDAAGRDGKDLLVVSRLVKNFTVTAGAVLQRRIGQVSAVADVSFAIPAGSTFGLVGESGCGKTTVGRLIVGLEKPVHFAERDYTFLFGALTRAA